MFELEFHSPETAEELNVLLEQTKGQVVAGGTDVLPQLRRGQLRSTCLVDITRLKQLRFIRDVDGYIHIGALTTYAEVIASPLLQLAAPALVTAAATVGCPQTRYRGTLGGNLANASPAADSAPPLLSLEAKASLASIRGERSIPLQDFFSGPGKTNLAPTEYITSISFCRPAGRWGTAFYKLGKRNGMAISIVSAAAYLELDLDGL